ncbi:MAG: gliding motility protein GldL [Sinomicrobium sp.]|nr:gliding motility protein GldL [Sinomicrobium sp.]
MAQSRSRKQLFNMAYGLGASIVIVGALFKILHWEIGFLTGGLLLAVGLITEALIFAVSAFEPVEEDLDWSLVYPELSGGKAQDKGEREPEGMLSKKLDQLLSDAKIDSELMGRLGESIRDFGAAAKNMAPTTEAVQATRKYGEELAQAAAQMEALNSLYKIQIDIANRQTTSEEDSAGAVKRYSEELTQAAGQMEALNNLYKTQLEIAGKQAVINEEMNLNSDALKKQMQELAANLSSLNNVYGGMLSAMNRS